MAKLLGPMDILVRPQPSSCFRAMWGCCSSHGNHWGSAVAQAPAPTLSLGWAALEAGFFLLLLSARTVWREELRPP